MGAGNQGGRGDRWGSIQASRGSPGHWSSVTGSINVGSNYRANRRFLPLGTVWSGTLLAFLLVRRDDKVLWGCDSGPRGALRRAVGSLPGACAMTPGA